MKLRIYIVALLMAMSGCLSNQSEMDEQSDKPTPTSFETINPDRVLKAAFLIVNGVYNSELVAPMDILQHTVFHTDKGIEVFTIAPTKDPITTFEGLKIIPDFAYATDSFPKIDILIVPSAEHSMDTDLENEEMIAFVRNVGSSADYVMSLCDGAFVLAKAGLVDGKQSTTFPSDIERYRKMFPKLEVHENVSFVHDGNLITSAGGAKSYDPALYLTEILYGKTAAEGVGKGLVIDWKIDEIKYKRVEN